MGSAVRELPMSKISSIALAERDFHLGLPPYPMYSSNAKRSKHAKYSDLIIVKVSTTNFPTVILPEQPCTASFQMSLSSTQRKISLITARTLYISSHLSSATTRLTKPRTTCQTSRPLYLNFVLGSV